MSDRALRTSGRAVAVVGLAIAVVGAVFLALNKASGKVPLYSHWLPDLLMQMSSAAIAFVILGKQPRNAFGWLLLGVGVSGAIGDGGSQLAAYLHSVARVPGAAWVNWVGTVLGQGWFLSWLVPQLYPDGRPLTPRWRVLLWFSLSFVVLATGVLALTPGQLDDVAKLNNPVGVHVGGGLKALVTVLAAALGLVVVCGGLASIFLRYRRATGIERQQMKVFTFVVFMLPVAVIVQDRFTGSFIIGGLATAALPVALGIAVLRYGLYEIDRLVSRTVSYAIVTGLVVAVYVAAIAVTEYALHVSSTYAVAASTLAAAALFQPLRIRVQRLVDRRFDRAAYDARRTVDEFAIQLRDEVDVDAVRAGLLSTVATAVAPSGLSLWVAP